MNFQFHAISSNPMEWAATEQVADALGITSSESITAITRAFQYLGVNTSYSGQFTNSVRPIIIPLKIGLQVDCFAQFDHASGTWEANSADAKHFVDDDTAKLHPRQRPLRPLRGQSEIKYRERDEDWTERLPLTQHVEFVRSRNWSATTLGPMREWPLTLRLMTSKMLSDPRPACIYWGKDRIAIYNEPFVTIAFSRHPSMMGSAARDAMPATWPFLSQMFDEVERSGKAFSAPEFEMMVHKEAGFLEEAWYDGVWSPIHGLDGAIEGFYNSGYEITRLKLLDRRNRLLHRISAPPDLRAKTVWQHIIDSCEPFDRDVPMMILYSAQAENPTQSSSCSLRLEGSIGIQKDDQAIPNAFDLQEETHVLLPYFRASKASGTAVRVESSDGSLPNFLDNVEWRGFGERAKVVVVVPLFVTGLIAGFAVAGLNPRVPWDEDQKQFVNDFRHVTTAVLCETTSYEQAQAREARLSKDLTDREKFIRKLAQIATVGIYSTSPTGVLTYANPKFHQMTGMVGGVEDAQNSSVVDLVLEDDRPKAIHALDRCKLGHAAVSVELRLKSKWTPPGSLEAEHFWVSNSMTPYYEDGEFTSVIGCLSDISHAMWALQLQKNLVSTAEEAKRQQERFIDVTSHEMRNPLSAVMQCADSICTSVDQHSRSEMLNLLDSIRDSAQTILFCTAHQKRIIDDILTVSKLDSSLLVVTPILVEPSDVAQKALQMFEGELAAFNITSTFTSNHSHKNTWAHCDPTRLTQILINLLTNAIKFTKTSEKRKIHLVVGTTTIAPPAEMKELQWFPKRPRSLDESSSNGELYWTFKVQDTGSGMSLEETSRLFNRFSQASPMTHVKYGGSGLGLFISRELTELQGGMIGVASTPGEGSSFGLYMRLRNPTPAELESKLEGLRPPGAVPGSARRPSAPGEPRHVLLVEDNLINQKVLLKQLQRHGCIVHVANHGLEALDFIRTTRYWNANNDTGVDLTAILMDWEMPVCDGLTATRRLRKMEKEGLITERLHIIAATANARSEQVAMAYEAGSDDVLAKPFTVAQAIKKIDRG